MNLLAALLLAANSSTRASALAWADRLYREAPAISASLDPWYNAYSAYQQVEKRYGSSGEVTRRLATCCLRIGDFEQADQRASQLANRTDPLVAEVRSKLELKTRFQKLIPAKEQVIDFVRVGGDRWAVLSGEQDMEMVGVFFRKLYGPMVLRSVDARTAHVSPKIDLPDAAYSGHLYLWRDLKGTATVIAGYSTPAADCSPGVFQFYRVGSGRPRNLATLNAVYDINGYPAGRVLAVSVGVIYKKDWTDFYEWDGQRLRFANDRHPGKPEELDWFRSRGYTREDRSDYSLWLELAAKQCIWKRWSAANKSLREAERNCRLSLLEQARGVDRFSPGGHHEFGYYGDTATNLRLIRQRLRWLASGDYNHRLLYRPFDGDFQDRPELQIRSLEVIPSFSKA